MVDGFIAGLYLICVLGIGTEADILIDGAVLPTTVVATARDTGKVVLDATVVGGGGGRH